MKLSVLFISLCFSLPVLAQVQGSSGLKIIIEGGKVLKHHDYLSFSTAQFNQMIRLQYQIQVDSSVYWADFYHYPRIGLELNYLRYGDSEILGQAISFLPQITFPLFSFRKSSLDLHLGTGISYLTKKYNKVSNPGNKAISTHLNNLTHLGFSYNYRFNNYAGLNAGFSLWHNSNGAFKRPNSGLNNLHLSLAYYNRFIHRPFFSSPLEEYKWYSSRFWVEINTGIAYHVDKEKYNGPQYLLISHELRFKYRAARLFFVSLGISTDLNNEYVDYFLNKYVTYNRKKAEQLARRYAISVGGEFLFGRMGLGTQLGYYVTAEFKPFPIYNKLYVRYYFLGASPWFPLLHLDIVLKSHLAVAEYIALRVGLTFKK